MKYLLTVPIVLACVGSSALAGDFVVTNVNSSGPGSLSQAINDANAAPGRDNILFNIPGAGVHVINASGQLPQITDPVIIDGYTQPGAQPNTQAVGDNAVILIEIDTHTWGGPVITAGASMVRGLSITGFNSWGISLQGPGTANIIEGNFIGLHPDGQTATAGNIGIEVKTTGNMIGGISPAARNVIAGQQSSTGVSVQGQPNTLCGNYIGTDASGLVPRPHNVGVLVSNGGVVVGGSSPGAGNLISGTFAAIQLSSDGTQVLGNYVGVGSDGKTPLKNNGIGILVAGNNNTIGGLAPGAGNAIAFFGSAGVYLEPSVNPINNAILSNSIYGRGPAIKLGVDGPHPNDNLDLDEGPNHLQNFPVLTSFTPVSGGFIVDGMLNSTPNTQFTIQFFGDETEYVNPARTFLKTITVTTDNNGNAQFSTGVSSMHGAIDATATDPAGNTSEFFLRESRFRNLSTRGRVEPGDNALIGGVIAYGIPLRQTKIIVRALGPSLAVNGTPIAGRLEDPILEIYGRNGLISSNDNWSDDPNTAADLQKYGLTPASELEAAAEIDPGNGGNFTAIVRGKNNSSGIALVEFYDVINGATMYLANVSTRGLVQGGDNVMIGGFIAGDGNGQFPFVLRALGPSLSGFGVQNPLPDPFLELHDSNGDTLWINDNWQEDEPQKDDIIAAGLAPSDPKESAMLMMLPPGAYTAIVRGNGGGTGLALVEIYQLP
ncbi:MAG TPA: hypothetical protein VF751_00850 [Chthoniobacterales bacterium]